MARGIAGGKVSGRLQRERALVTYYKNPNRCLFCNSIINIGAKQKVNQVRKKKFCNRSHAASYNNRKDPKRRPRKYFCIDCNSEIKRERLRTGRLSKKRYCSSCVSKRAFRRFELLTKGSLFANATYYTSARTRITRHARFVYISSALPLKCFVCNYEPHVHICHISAVSTFSNDAVISEINALGNLVALCPNHHWEFDNGKLKLKL